MTRRNVLLRQLHHQRGLDAVRHAHQQFDELRALAIPEALEAAKSLDHVFTEALVIGYTSPEKAHDCLRSHFYVNEIISLDHLITQAKRKKFSSLLNGIQTRIIPALKFKSSVFKRLSKPIEPRTLSIEMDLMLNTIRAAHAPTAAISAATCSI